MSRAKLRATFTAIVVCLLMALAAFTLAPVSTCAYAEEDTVTTESELNERLLVRYAMDDTAALVGNVSKIAAEKWDSATKAFVTNSALDATVKTSASGYAAGTVKHADGIEGSGALTFTKKAHAQADFTLPADSDGMTVSMWVKNINTYWSSLVEFWNGTDGGRFGKGTMQGNGGRRNENDPWSSNCPAHNSATMAEGGGWDSFVINVNSGDNGGSAVDPMVANKWYHIAFTLTSTEMRAYRDGELKQTFGTMGNSSTILASIMRAAKSGNGKLGIRLCHDANDGDILDDFRIYNGVLTAKEVRALCVSVAAPEYYDEIEGLGYPTEMLFGGATSVTDGESGKKEGTTSAGIKYSYTPLTVASTPANDKAGVVVTFDRNGMTWNTTVKFRRRLEIKAGALGYKIGEGENVPVAVPENPADDIIVKVAADADLTQIKAGDSSALMLDGDSDPTHYTAQFTYSAATHTATVRVSYTVYSGCDAVYTLVFVNKSTETIKNMSVTGGKRATTITLGDFTENSANIEVADISSFTLAVKVALCEGASIAGGDTLTLTESNLSGGKLKITVTNENGDEVEYFLVPVVYSSDANLSALSAGSYELEFEAGKTEYTVTIDKGDGFKLFEAVSATAASDKATVKKLYDTSENAITVTVTAEDGVTVKKYIIRITERDTDATLSDIKVGGVSIVGFNPLTYDYTVKYAGSIPAVTATANSPTASEPSISAADASGKVTVTVTAENGDTKTYTVTLIKMSSDASLTKLTLNGTEITFTDNEAHYEAASGVRVESIAVVAEVAAGATVAYKVSEANKEIVITVTAEDGTTAKYVVKVQIAPSGNLGGGETVDNSPSGGCGSSLGGADAFAAMLVLFTAALLIAVRARKSRA